MEPVAVTLHPEIAALQADCVRLRERLGDLLADRDTLLNRVKPALETRFQAKVGRHRFEVLKLECEVRRLRRQAELVQARLNRSEPVHMGEICRQLETEFEEWIARVDQIAAAVANASPRGPESGHGADPARARKIVDTFRAIARKLHPDANPDLPPEALNLWLQAVHAYRHGDLDALETVSLLLQDVGTGPPLPSELTHLKDQRSDLRERIAALLEELAGIRSTFPFDLERNLADPAWVGAQVKECEADAERLLAERSRLQMLLRELLGEMAGPQEDGPDWDFSQWLRARGEGTDLPRDDDA